MMQNARVLLARLIDYAGLFPPAALPLEEAVATYARHRRGAWQWMLARFVVPVVRLEEMVAAQAPAGDERPPAGEAPPLMVAAIARPPAAAAELLDSLREDARRIAAAMASRVVAVDQIEIRLPRDLETGAGLTELLLAADRVLGAELPRAVLLAVEAPLAGRGAGAVVPLVAALARANQAPRAYGSAPFSLKLRCGGTSAAEFPTAAELAAALAACRDHNVSFKATQGLHHAYPSDDPTGATAHGLINLAAAAVLARAAALPAARLEELLADRHGSHFSLDAGGLTWQDASAGVSDIAAGRRFGLLSIGSCSFEEPIEDLRAAGLLREEQGA